jgi:hypothetical protein
MLSVAEIICRLWCVKEQTWITGGVILIGQTEYGEGGSGVPKNFVRGGVQQIQLRTERTGICGR